MVCILVIEDNPEIISNVVEFLEAEDFETLSAENGRIGLELAFAHRVDLILCDVMMPELDGYGVLNALRQNPATATTPFVFLTAKGERQDLRTGMNLGADDYLIKPFTPDELLEAIAARLSRSAQLEQYDSLTGLPQISAFSQPEGFFTQAVAQSDLTRSLIPLMLIGLDRLERIQEAIGHRQGEEVLKVIAQRLTQLIQPLGGQVAKGNGGQFAVMLPPVADQSVATERAQEILEVINEPAIIGYHRAIVTASMGIGFYPLATSFDELQRQASIALGNVKSMGGNHYRIYVAPLFGLDQTRDLKLEEEFYQAWSANRFEIRYQPRIEIKKRHCVSVVALLHWEHPLMGGIPENKLSQLITVCGLNLVLDQWILDQACQQIKTIQDRKQPLRIVIQVSEQLFNEDLLAIIDRTCQTHGFPTSRLDLEFAANTLLVAQNQNQMAATLRLAKQKGISITLKDLGHNNQFLNQLGSLAIDALKLDGSSMQHLQQNQPLIKAMIQLCHNWKLKAIAPEIATQEQQRFLQRHNCDLIQYQQSYDIKALKRRLLQRF
ncbi:EAL domain-containing protein [Roseofilum sp. Guam]|uniref:EAL domain-containing protein n=1 Tax=Roseofilum sp. Guam TaxID=2821502 RepID=UPI001B023A5E|nr:EAL domain-containing protein [Roseofilum sp. Guam]MBP0027923.1 EAL domain-containing protein [Roseofilum sp. Guam]